MFKEKKTSIVVLCIVAFLVISLATSVVEAAFDIDWLAITSYKDGEKYQQVSHMEVQFWESKLQEGA